VSTRSLRATLDPAPTAVTNALHVLTAVRAPDGEADGRARLDSLRPADSPRRDGIDAAHVQALAEAAEELPPILVQRSTRRVIDGMHRLAAARRNGQVEVGVRFVDCGDEDACALAVATNITGERPLSAAERRAAAARILRHRPEASDRLIAELAGLTPRAVGNIRRLAAGTLPNVARRVGRDGRIRPLNTSDGRKIASQILAADPDASLREIARRAGISIGTAHDVREKVRRGSDPVTPKARCCSKAQCCPKCEGARDDAASAEPADFDLILRRLRQDPALRYCETGRSLLGWLSQPRLLESADWQQIIDSIPPHRRPDVIAIASSCARAWGEFARELERRDR
jgi:ParB-like chromosome segregation protein Spo0J